MTGNAEVEGTDIHDLGDLLDSEVIAMTKVDAVLSRYIGRGVELSAFQREVRERYAEIGFVVRCDFYKDMNDPRPWDEKPEIPRITYLGRTEKQGEFDHEQMGHEVRSNILGKNKQGDIQKKLVGQTGFERKGSGLIVPKGS